MRLLTVGDLGNLEVASSLVQLVNSPSMACMHAHVRSPRSLQHGELYVLVSTLEETQHSSVLLLSRLVFHPSCCPVHADAWPYASTPGANGQVGNPALGTETPPSRRNRDEGCLLIVTVLRVMQPTHQVRYKS
jgi:hypothetical protein